MAILLSVFYTVITILDRLVDFHLITMPLYWFKINIIFVHTHIPRFKHEQHAIYLYTIHFPHFNIFFLVPYISIKINTTKFILPGNHRSHHQQNSLLGKVQVKVPGKNQYIVCIGLGILLLLELYFNTGNCKVSHQMSNILKLFWFVSFSLNELE